MFLALRPPASLLVLLLLRRLLRHTSVDSHSLTSHLSHSHLTSLISHTQLTPLAGSSWAEGVRARVAAGSRHGRAAIAIPNQGALLVRVGDGAAIVICNEGALLVRVGDGAAIVICGQGAQRVRVRDGAAIANSSKGAQFAPIEDSAPIGICSRKVVMFCRWRALRTAVLLGLAAMACSSRVLEMALLSLFAIKVTSQCRVVSCHVSVAS